MPNRCEYPNGPCEIFDDEHMDHPGKSNWAEYQNSLRAIIHDLANAFSRLNTAASILYLRPEKGVEWLEAERKAASVKFNAALDRIK